MAAALLDVQGLTVEFATASGPLKAVRDVSLTVRRGETLAVVGESGSGKSTVLLAALGLLPASAAVTGSVRFDGEQLIGAGPRLLNSLRGGRIGMIFQDPMTSLNPSMTIGRQLAEAVHVHTRVSRAGGRARALELLRLVSIPGADKRLRAYPHELSGGMRQRVMIAIALANDPDLLIADEPTTALDVTVQAQILDVLADVREQRSLGVVFVTHDLGVVAGFASRVHVMYAGRIVETGGVLDVFDAPAHPYTRGLFGCLPRLDRPDLDITPIGGAPPSLLDDPPGCSFAPRCPAAHALCAGAVPALAGGPTRSACFLHHLEVRT